MILMVRWAKQFDYDNYYYYLEQCLCFVVLGSNLVRSYEDCPFSLEFQNFLIVLLESCLITLNYNGNDESSVDLLIFFFGGLNVAV